VPAAPGRDSLKFGQDLRRISCVTVATSNRQLDRAVLENELFAITRGLLEELGNRYALDSVRSGARLDRDLGLGSLDRVELMVRVDRALGTHLPANVMAEAETLDDVIAAIETASGAAAKPGEAFPEEHRAEPARKPAPADAAGDPLASAETWQEVLRYRARTDAARTHLILLEEGGEQRITFGELHESAAAVAAGLAHRGVTRGDAVALMLPTGREFFITFAGVLLAGAVPVPMYPPVRADRIAEYAARQ
jgi:fatty-acyl-CoA synthase